MKKFTAYFDNHPPVYLNCSTAKEARTKAKAIANRLGIKFTDIGDRCE